MTLDEAIEHCEEKAQCGTDCGMEHKQLAEWLKELKNLREEYEIEGEPGITIEEITWNLERAVEVTSEIEKALNLLHSILPSQTDALQNIKQEILDKKYLEE